MALPLFKKSVADLLRDYLLGVLDGSITPGPVGYARSLTERMFAKAPLVDYSLWLDTADVTYIYIAEAPTTSAATAPDFRGIRVVKDAKGNPLGKVQQANAFAWDSRGTATWQ